MSHQSAFPNPFNPLLPSLSSSSLNLDQMSLHHLPTASEVLCPEPDATRSLGAAVDRFASVELPAQTDMTSAALSGKGLPSFSSQPYAAPSYTQHHKEVYVENVVAPVVTNSNLPPFSDHPLEPSHIILHARAYLPDVLLSVQRALQNDLIDVEASGYTLRCTAHRFGSEISFVVSVHSYSSSPPSSPPVLTAFCLEVKRMSGDGMEFNDIFRAIHGTVYSAGFVDPSDGPLPDVPSSMELASTQSFDITYAEETLACFKSMCLSPMGDTRREGLAGLSDLAMTENPVLMPMFFRLEVPQLLLSLLYTEDEDSYRCAVSGLASLAIHQEVSRFLAAQSVQRNVLLTLAGRLPIERAVARSPAIIRHSIRLLTNMASFLGRDLVQNCLPEAQMAYAQISSEANTEFIQRMRDLQSLTGAFGDSE